MKYFVTVVVVFMVLFALITAWVISIPEPPKTLEQQKFELYSNCVRSKFVNGRGNLAECDSIKQ